ncbi:protein DENND6B-like isoform X1 [Lethenteron reissneri]|uniref:protein DENND6B-like isoform X1 n=1 Tax=Lethenteron reissneri TaxID=7753 RepID=UPI002AB7615C|nr:protein DENND6B-like isoform X1 [Lethenteron reissneri]
MARLSNFSTWELSSEGAGRAGSPQGACETRFSVPGGRPCSPEGIEGSQPSPWPWERFTSWLHSICVVTFDLELGQAIELIYPPHAKLTEKEKMNVCYLAFPDSNSGCHGDTQFSFRFRRSACWKASPRNAHGRPDEQHLPTLLQSDPHFLYGYVYFRQVRDKSLRRGYFQKSVVLLTRLPYLCLYSAVVRLIAPEYFDKLEPCMEAACNDIERWPPLVAGKTLSLPIMGVVIQVRIPTRNEKLGAAPLKQTPTENLLPAPLVLPTVHEPDLFRALSPVLPHVQLLWELVLLGEPLVVMATSPSVTSDSVLALVSCIAPLRFCSDFRPYFTIHDPEFREITTRTQAPPSVILGVTNPFFAKTLQHWPHILRIGETRPSAGDQPRQVKLRKASKLKALDAKPGVYTAHKPFLVRDRAIVKRLLKGVQRKRPVEVQSAILRRYLLELTQSFIIPLERYVASLMPLQKSVAPFKSPPQVRPFVVDEFVATLQHAGPQLTSPLRGDWQGLYRRFLRSQNFEGWLSARRRDMNHKLELLHMEALLNADVGGWVSGRSEVEAVDLVLQLQDKLLLAERAGLSLPEDTEAKLQACMHTALGALPKDLQAVLSRM